MEGTRDVKTLALNLHLHSKHSPPMLTTLAWGGHNSGGQGSVSLSKVFTADSHLAFYAGIKLGEFVAPEQKIRC